MIMKIKKASERKITDADLEPLPIEIFKICINIRTRHFRIVCELRSPVTSIINDIYHTHAHWYMQQGPPESEWYEDFFFGYPRTVHTNICTFTFVFNP